MLFATFGVDGAEPDRHRENQQLTCNVMQCMICGSVQKPYFEKNFGGLYGLGVVAYDRCGTCGFVASRIHAEMSAREWTELNFNAHSAYQGKDSAPAEDPRWLERLDSQTACLTALSRAGVLGHELPWLDFGCGDGKLAQYLELNCVPVLRFDRYMSNPAYLTEAQLASTRYNVVLNTSVFEHVRDREPLDEMAALVAQRGVFAIHTLVREEIPADPNWFYLLPMHCAFFTNRSMQLLFEQWGFHSSLYHVDSRLWFWFREMNDRLKQFLERPSGILTGETYFKQGFADYWK